MNIFSCLRNSSWPNPLCDYQMNGKDIRLSYTNLRGILDGKQTIRYESISDILISMFSGINKCSQGCNIFVIDFGSSQYQKFVISLICISAEFPAYNGKVRHGILVRTYWEYSSHLRRKLGKGKYLFSLPSQENHFFNISLLYFC